METSLKTQVQVTQCWETSELIQPVRERRRNLGGRPKKLPEERAAVKFYPSYTLAQWKKLQERAEAVGLAEVELIRRLSLELPLGRTLPVPSREALTLLSSATNNLNQISRRVNSGISTDTDKIMSAITETRNAILEMGASLHDK
ncbi:MAG: hypothetical protein WBC07_09160 [Methylotenera sp.]